MYISIMKLHHLAPILLLALSVQVSAQLFYLDENGITINCENCQPGDTGRVGGIIYEAVDRTLLEQRMDEGADLSLLCTSLVTSMEHLFSGMSEFNQDIGSWDVSHVTNMRGMFFGAAAFNQDIGAWNVSKVTRMDYLFHNAEIFNQDIGAWDVSKVTRMNCMFSGDSLSLDQMSEEPLYTTFNQDIGDWDVSNVTIMFQMFSYNSAFNQDIGDWDVSNVRNMALMFEKNEVFNQDISSWYFENVTDMDSLFFKASSFNQDISSWDVSDVKEMNYMFYDAESFNQDLSGWCVQNITTEPEAFAYNCPLQEDYYPVWGSCPEIDTVSGDSTSTIVYNIFKEASIVYPNPSNAIFTFDFRTPIRGELEIHRLNGQLIHRRQVTSSSEQIDLSGHAKGIYIVTVRSDAWVRTEKVVRY